MPDLSSSTWSCCCRLWNPGMLLANSTTSFTAGVKHWEKDSHTSWEERLEGATGHAFRGQAWRGRSRRKRRCRSRRRRSRRRSRGREERG